MAADYVPETTTIENPKTTVIKTKADKQILKIKKKKKAEASQQTYSSSEVVIDSDLMEYYPERSEVEAIGNAKVTLTKDKTELYADRIVFNHDLNSIKAYDNVKIVNKDSVTTGDFVNFDLNQNNGWMESPITKNYELQINAKEGYLYSDRIEEYDGVLKILKNNVIQFGSLSMDALVNPGNPNLGAAFESKDKEKAKGVYKIKAKTIYIDSQDEHNVLRMDNADIYLKKYKIASVPTITTVSNKEQRLLDTNFPEFGQLSELGAYVGPGFVFNMPRSSTLKLAPILNCNDSKVGAGLIARYRNANNLTDIAYGSAANNFLIRGSQTLTDHLQLDYNQNTLMDEWFLGPRRPRYGTQLLYKTSSEIKDLNAIFSQRFSGGYYADMGKQIGDGEGRLRYQAQIFKPFYSYNNDDLHIKLGGIAQTSLSVYSTGDNVPIVRAGPIFSTAYKKWSQDVIYFQTAWSGKSPFLFDEYMYGKSNAILIENYRINKNVSIGYLTSLALLNDNYENKMMQESRLLLSLGPEYARLIFGYDTKRKTTMMLFSMLVGTEGSEVKFKKAVLKNPDNMSKKPDPLFDFTKVKYYRDKIFTPPLEPQSDKSKFEAIKEETEAMQIRPDNDRIPVIQPMMPFMAPQQWMGR